MFYPITLIATSFVLTFVLIKLFTPAALKLQLVDTPDHRKQHTGTIPLTGGIAMFFSIALHLILTCEVDQKTVSLLAASTILIAIGVIDDIRDISWKQRTAVEFIATSIMIIGGGVLVTDLGDLIGTGPIHMPYWLAFVFTQIATFGVINCINMIDGVDGLAASIVLTAFIGLLMITDSLPLSDAASPLFLGSLGAFLICNLGLFRSKKIFLGDSGTMFAGFVLSWMLIEAAMPSGNHTNGIKPVTALYFISIPMFDMVATTLLRVINRDHPFKADRNHIHHLMLRAGFSATQTLFVLLTANIGMIVLGAWLEKTGAPEAVMFGLYMVLFGLYFAKLLLTVKRSEPEKAAL